MPPKLDSLYAHVAHSIESLPLSYMIPGILITFILAFILKRRYLSPLRRFPGPFWASVTRWWLVHQIFRGDHEKTMLRLHAKYGPIIRISPFEVAISDPEAIKTIYGHTSNFTKVPPTIPSVFPSPSPLLSAPYLCAFCLGFVCTYDRVTGIYRGITKMLEIPVYSVNGMKELMR